jgi:hypothetical protein
LHGVAIHALLRGQGNRGGGRLGGEQRQAAATAAGGQRRQAPATAGVLRPAGCCCARTWKACSS